MLMPMPLHDKVSQNLVEIPVVDSLARIPASVDRRFQFILVKAVPGTSADLLYQCLGNNASPTVYSWIQVATG